MDGVNSFIGATFLACDTQPIETIDDPVGVTEAELARFHDVDTPASDLDGLVDHAANTTIDLLRTITPEDIEAIRAGEITVQDAVGLDDGEYIPCGVSSRG